MRSLLPQNVYAGDNSTENLKIIVEDNNFNQLVIFTDKGIVGAGLVDYLQSYLSDKVNVRVIDNIAVEPSYQEVQKSIDIGDDFIPDLVIGLGGGSVIDAAKLFSVLYKSKYTVKDLLSGQKVTDKALPSLMIPTTCGTGAEGTINSIVSIPEEEVKKGIVLEKMMPDYVILDSYYLRNLPKHILASSAIDAFCHGIECFTSVKANLISDMYAKACCELIFNNLEKAYHDDKDSSGRLSLLIGSFFGGLAITSSGTTAVHALSYPLGGKYHIPHGVSNAILLFNVMKLNQDAIIPELSQLSQHLLSAQFSSTDLSDIEKADYLLEQVGALIEAVDIPKTLSNWHVTKDDVAFLTESALQQRRLLDNNKKKLTYDEVKSIYISVID